MPVDTLRVPGHSKIVPDRLETDTLGMPFAVVSVAGGIGRDTYGLRWADSAWVETWKLGYGVGLIPRADAPRGRYPLLWKAVDEIGGTGATGYTRLVMNEAFVHSIAPTDTIGSVLVGHWVYSGAVSRSRRWAVVDDLIFNTYRGLRMFYSDAPRVWTELRLNVVGNRGVAAAALDDTSALVVWALDVAPYGLRWGTLRGQSWVPRDSALSTHINSAGPELRRRPSGGFWLGWTHGEDEVLITTYREGAWAQPETIRCAYRSSDRHRSQPPDLSHDPGEYPVVAWFADNARTGAQTICVCVPTDSGFGVAEELEGPFNSVGPTVARDRNGDVWVVWSLDRVNEGMLWTHTYTTVTATTPVVTIPGRSRRVDWSLTAPAPGSWWAVLRARGSGPFEEVARVRAGPGLELSWTDTAPPEGPLRYKVRRESVDLRYRLDTAEALWPDPDRQPLRFAAVPAPFQDGMRVELVGAAAGTIELVLYDLQGRQVFHQQRLVSGTGQDTLTLDLSAGSTRPRPGIYFLIARDSAGHTAAPARLVLLR